MKRILAFLAQKSLYLGICRYLLALTMLPYAVSKLCRLQFVVLPVSTWALPLEKLSGIYLTWSFLGYAPWFQVLLGFFELVPALLLLFRRTMLAGALLMLPMTVSVFLVNHAFHLWPGTRLISLALLLLNVLILLLEWNRIAAVFQVILQGRKTKGLAIESGLNLVVVGTLLYFLAPKLSHYRGEENELTGDWYHKHPNEWSLQSEYLRDSVIRFRPEKIYFGPEAFSKIDDGFHPHSGDYVLDRKKHTVLLHDHPTGKTTRYIYRLAGDSLRLQRLPDTSGRPGIVLVYKKRVINN